MITAASVSAMLRTRGRTVTLRRTGSADLECIAMVAEKGVVDGLGSIAQFRRQVTISNSEIATAAWPGPPQKSDQIVDDGKVSTIQAVLTHRIGDEVVMHTLEILGA